MAKTQKNIPNGWQEIKLYEIASKISDGIHTTPKYVEKSSFYFINGNNLINDRIVINKETKCVSEDEYNKYKKDLNNQTILVSINGTIGNIAIYDGEKVILGKSAAYINCVSDINKNFVFNFLKTLKAKRYFDGELTGSTIRNLSIKSIRNTKLILPPLPEQTRIVTILETWDKAVDLLAKKIELKKKIKKGLMQRLLTGKVRLPGFSEKWHTIKLGDVGEIITGNTPPMKDKENYGGQYCWATAEDFNVKYIRDTVIKLSEIGKSCSRFLPAGSILVTCIASIGKNAIAGVPLATNQQINSVVVNDEHNNEFIYYLIENSKNLLIKNAGAGAMQILNKSVFSKLKIKVPKTKEEQDAIAKILVTTDDEIRTLNCKLSQLKDQKKYLLNNLITGKIRTPENLLCNNGAGPEKMSEL